MHWLSLLLLHGNWMMQSTNSLCLIYSFRCEIAICLMKTPLGFPLRLIYLQTFVLMELTTQRFQSHKGCASSTRKMPYRNTCGKCGACLHCDKGAVCFDIYHTNIWLKRFYKNEYFMKHSRFRNRNQHFVHSDPVSIFVTQKSVS